MWASGTADPFISGDSLLKTYLEYLTRDIKRKVADMDAHLTQLIERPTALLKQKRHDKNKIYSVHEYGVHCMHIPAILITHFGLS